MMRFALSDLDREEKEPLICADLRTEDCVNQRFLLFRKTNRTKKAFRGSSERIVCATLSLLANTLHFGLDIFR
jgi:hypothetical protein